MRHVALEIPLRLFAFGWRTQRHRAADTRVQPLRYSLDHTTLAGGIAAFEQHHQFETVGDDPILKGDQFTLQVDQFAKIGAAVQCRSLNLVGDFGITLGKPEVIYFQFKLFIENVFKLGVNPG